MKQIFCPEPGLTSRLKGMGNIRSTDCGQNWQKVYKGGSFQGLLLHPEDPYTLFACANLPTGGLLRTKEKKIFHWTMIQMAYVT